MKRVSFKVARILKEAGYPQEGCSAYYDSELDWDDYDVREKFIAAPYATEVWFWLWREKKISIDIDCYNGFWSSDVIGTDCNDPEEAIIAAIEYLVDNNLIK